jgi:voltage-gated potassium channel
MKKFWNVFLMAMAIAYLAAFSYPAFVTEVSPKTKVNLDVVQWASWIVFAADLLAGLLKSLDRKRFIKTHIFEIATVLLPFLRPLRLMRVISFGSLVLQKVAIGRQLAITVKVVIASLFLAYIAAIQITITERPIETSNIKNLEDGLWWAITTVTTVGYGDKFPTTSTGRILAVTLMLVGISLMGVITASVAAWFVRISQEQENVN